jgi:hypothetical protein
MIRIDHYPSAVQDAATETPDRARQSVRRTSHLQMVVCGSSRVGVEVRGAARDLLTAADGEPRVLGEATLEATFGAERTLASIATTPRLPGVDAMVGSGVGRGLGGAIARVLAGAPVTGSPVSVLLDDLPIATLLSSYADEYIGAYEDLHELPAHPPADVCAGWASGGTVLELSTRNQSLANPVGPVAPVLERADDRLAWHAVPVLPEAAMRRRRLLDVRQIGGSYEVSAMFRDSLGLASGAEQILHEYSLEATVEDGALVRCDPRPRVLPWPECPSAAASAQRVLGLPLSEIRAFVRAELGGTSTCTHLSQMLLTLSDVEVLTHSFSV